MKCPIYSESLVRRSLDLVPTQVTLSLFLRRHLYKYPFKLQLLPNERIKWPTALAMAVKESDLFRFLFYADSIVALPFPGNPFVDAHTHTLGSFLDKWRHRQLKM